MRETDIQAAVYDVYEATAKVIVRRIDFLDRQCHEHGPECELRCPRNALRSELLDCMEAVGAASQKYFMRDKDDE